MDYLAEHQRMLKLAAADQLPREIDESSELSVKVCRELYETGLLDAIDGRSFDGDAFMEPRITVRGREYLNDLEQRAAAASPTGRVKRIGERLAYWVGGILTAVVVAWILNRLGLTGSLTV